MYRPVLSCESKELGRVDQIAPWAKALLEKPTDFILADKTRVWKNNERYPSEGFTPKIPDGFAGIVSDFRNVFGIKEPRWFTESWATDEIRVYVEAKTKIRTAGELLRQINLYRSVTSRSARFIVVAPASAWEPDLREILEEQGVATLNFKAN